MTGVWNGAYGLELTRPLRLVQSKMNAIVTELKMGVVRETYSKRENVRERGLEWTSGGTYVFLMRDRDHVRLSENVWHLDGRHVDLSIAFVIHSRRILDHHLKEASRSVLKRDEW